MMLKWIDEYAWIAASRDYPDCTFVTIALDDIVFKHRVKNGSILHFHIERVRQKTTSVAYNVDVYDCAQNEKKERHVFTTSITFVRIDKEGKKKPLPPQEQIN